MTPTARPPGVAGERTQLAWQRTTLSGLTCSLVVARLIFPMSMIIAIVVALLAVTTTLVLGWLASRPYLTSVRTRETSHALRDGRQHFAITVLLIITGLGALAFILV